MKIGLILSAAALCVAAVAVAASPVQDAKAKSKPDDKAAMGGNAAMEAWMKAGKPGEKHAAMAKCVGTWTTHTKSWMDPTQPPEESTGSSTFEMIMGGRYLVEHVNGNSPMMGGAWEGMGLLAYNNVTGEYEHVWLDSNSTGLFESKGKEAADGSVEFHGDMVDAATKANMKCRMVFKPMGDNARHFEMYCTQGGQEMKMMEIDYTRGAGR